MNIAKFSQVCNKYWINFVRSNTKLTLLNSKMYAKSCRRLFITSRFFSIKNTSPNNQNTTKPKQPRGYLLCRFDDNGNKFVVKQYDNVYDATNDCDTFNRRGHKQIFFVEPMDK